MILIKKTVFSVYLQRYYEVYHLIPNTTYEFRLWANNLLGSGEIVSTSATTLSQLSDESKLANEESINHSQLTVFPFRCRRFRYYSERREGFRPTNLGLCG